MLVENTTIIAHKIDKLRLQNLEDQHIKRKIPKIDRINFENNGNAFSIFFFRIPC